MNWIGQRLRGRRGGSESESEDYHLELRSDSLHRKMHATSRDRGGEASTSSKSAGKGAQMTFIFDSNFHGQTPEKKYPLPSPKPDMWPPNNFHRPKLPIEKRVFIFQPRSDMFCTNGEHNVELNESPDFDGKRSHMAQND
jgi:hypothetical protein